MTQKCGSSDPSSDSQCPATRDLGAFDSGEGFTVSEKPLDKLACPGTLVAEGRYRVREELARGGMGIVLRAYDDLLERDVAIKILLKEYESNKRFKHFFLSEALLTSRLQHPCIVPIYDRGQSVDGRPYFAMKLVSGETLKARLESESEDRLERSRMLKVFEQVCHTVAYVHSRGILHLDLKPQNVMVGEFGEVHLMDWGLARQKCQAAEQVRATNSVQPSVPADDSLGHVFGTPAYMAPEQAMGSAVDERADVFGLGGILCEILTGRPPFRGEDGRRVYSRAVLGKVDDAMRGLDACGREDVLVDLAKACLAAEPDSRPADASCVANTVAHYLGAALEQAESDLCRFFELTLDLMCIATLDGYFTRVNANFPKILGYPEQELISKPFLDFVHPEDVQGTLDVMGDLLRGKSVVRFRNRYRHIDGSYVVLEWTARPIREEGIIFAIARDVTPTGDNANSGTHERCDRRASH